ncbi:hypothetical protein A0H81_03825 [Grifola frondosa]|uniref:Uncharacterized protein n=1 Tax=Grifola frondosa TaxID=5627 RepID=A0A1C7MK95_GRIFR|nr:hypothetical protein A0H81_03825 [Grifola frondosa]
MNRSEETAPTLDIASSIQGMYRILDLISEQGSGGLVEKIIIDQDSLGRFIRDLRPSAYTSVTKVTGFFGTISDLSPCFYAAALAMPVDSIGGSTRQNLRSGLYIILLGTIIRHRQFIVAELPSCLSYQNRGPSRSFDF